MKIQVDTELCSGHARCNAVAPEVYDIDDSGYCAISTLEVAPALEAAAQRGADACPEQAITVTES